MLVEKKPIAVALLLFINFNLNCGDISTMTGRVLSPNTVVSGMTLADVLGGFFAVGFDVIVQALFTKVGGIGISNWVEGIAFQIVGSPLGFGFNANGRGPVGSVGRLFNGFNDYVRGCGETLGGDNEQGEATREAASKDVKEAWQDIKHAPQDILDGFLEGRHEPHRGEPRRQDDNWKVDNDMEGIFHRIVTLPSDVAWMEEQGEKLLGAPSPSPNSPAFDNPAAEEF